MRRAFLLAGLMAALAACGGGDDEAVASLEDTTTTTEAPADATENAETVMMGFAQCMRDNGVTDFPDPQMDSQGNLSFFDRDGGEIGGDVDEPTLEAAQEECAPIIEALALDFIEQNQTEIQDRLLAFAECMRDEGVDLPDPDFSQLLQGGQGGGPFGDVDPDDPAFQAAAEECSSVFEGAFGFPGGTQDEG